MMIDLTPEQYRELVHTVVVGTIAREAAMDMSDDPNIRHVHDIEEYLLSYAKAFDALDLTEEDEDGALIASDETVDSADAVLFSYDESKFWLNLPGRLGMRDFLRTATPAERESIEAGDDLPARLFPMVERYAAEFQEHGLDRLEVKR